MIKSTPDTWRLRKSGMMRGLVLFFSILCLLPLLFILYFIIKQGIGVIDWSFLSEIPRPVGISGGGIINAIVGTLIIILVTTIISVPIGIIGGVYLYEFKEKRLTRLVSTCIDTLYGIPSIVLGIVAYFWIVRPMGGFSGLSGSIALAIMMIPIIIRSTEETLLQLPPSIREAAFGLGLPYHKIVFKVLIPCGFSGIISGILLSVARVIGETAPLLFTAFGSPFLNSNLSQPMETLPHLIYKYAMSPYESWQELAWGAAFILLVVVLILNIVTKLITRRWQIQS